MNNTRRKALEEIKQKIEELVSQLSCDIKEQLEAIRDEEQEYLDNMPENLYGGERYEASETAISNIEDSISELENLDPDTFTNGITEAMS